MPTEKAISTPIDVQIFYDESGKQNEKMHFMDAILIPNRIYKQKNSYTELDKLIKEGKKLYILPITMVMEIVRINL